VNGKFFTFPLCVLAMPLDEKDILQHICSHALERAGGGNGAEQIDDQRIREYLIDHENQAGGYNQSERHKQVIRGAIITNVTIGWIKGTIDRCDAVNNFVAVHERKHGTDPLVFIAAELFWSCHNDQDFSFREFSTACAVNSVIGFKKTPVIIRRAMIIARQLGYKTPAVMAAELVIPRRHDFDNPPLPKSKRRQSLSVQQLRDTLDNLERRDLFRRCQTSRRTVYFSTILDRTELLAAAKERIEKKNKLQKLRQQEREMFTKLDGNQSGTNQEPLKKETGKNGKIGTTKGETSQKPDGSQPETAGGTTDGTTSGTTKINAFETNAPLTNAFKQERVNEKIAFADSVQGLVGSIARGMTASSYPEGGEPSLDDVRVFMNNLFRGAGEYAVEWHKRMRDQAWKDNKGQPVKDWKKIAASWASGCEKRKRGVANNP
jgi:hypothetical protein